MSLYVAPGAAFDADADFGYSGAASTIGVTIYDTSGNIIINRQACDLEAAPNLYTKHFAAAPSVADQYILAWNDTATNQRAYEDLIIGSVAIQTVIGTTTVSSGFNAISNRVRRSVRDYPAKDVLFASCDVGDTTISVANPGIGYAPGQMIVIDAEAMLITSTASGPDAGSTFNVNRGWMGTSGSVHSAGSPILIGVRFAPTDILDAMNEGVQMLWPYFFKMVEDTSITVTDYLQSDYALPAAFGSSGLVTSMEILLPSLPNSAWGKYRWFHHRQGAGGRTLQLIRVPPPGTKLRLVGIAPFTELFDFTSATPSAQMTDHALAAVVLYAKYELKMVDEAARQNIATAKNIGPAAVQGGQNSSLAQMHYQQWLTYCQSHAQRYPMWHTRRAL